MEGGKILEFSPNGLKLFTYWSPSFPKTKIKGKSLINKISYSIQKSLKMYTSDDKEFGLMLSGGLDSRAILSAFDGFKYLFTTGLYQNNEFNIASRISKLSNSKHIFIKRELTHFDNNLDQATSLGGMHVYNEAQFINLSDKIKMNNGSIMIGLYLDILFGGLYLPKTPVNLFGKGLFHHKFMNFPKENLNEFFINNVKYRLKTSDPLSIIKNEFVEILYSNLKFEVERIMNYARSCGAENLNLWEYMHLHNLSRHYSYPMIESIRTFSDCRVPALTNQIYELSLSMDPFDKLNGNPYQKAITSLNPKIMEIENANTNLKAKWSLKRQSYTKAFYFITSKFKLSQFPRNPKISDRSWPSVKEQLDKSENILKKVHELHNCNVLNSIEIIDTKKVKNIVLDHLNNKSDNSVLINLLLTISNVLR